MVDEAPPPSRGPGRMAGALLSDRYRVTTLLGEGGMGEVYLGEHVLMRKRVAIKVLHPDMMAHDEVVARFEREAMAAAHIDHPNVATATDFGRTPEGSFFLVLEYIEGRSLRDALGALGALPPARALHIARQVTLALVRAHELGIVHRDLKPENVMLVARGQDTDFVKVLDFGIAKVPVQELTGKATVADPLTRMGVMYGTPEYMAPEQALGQSIDHRADLYALGVMLYEMVAGSRPFDANDPVSLVAMHITTAPEPPSARNPAAGVPAPVEALVLGLMQKDPAARPASAQEVLDAIDAMGFDLGPGRASAPSSLAFGRATAPDWSPPSTLATEAAVASPPSRAFGASAQSAIEPSAAYLPTHVAAPVAVTATGAPVASPGPTDPAPLALARPDAPLARAFAALAPLRARLPGLLAEARGSLEQLRARLPAPLGRLPLAAIAAAAALPLLALVILTASLLGGPSIKPDANDAGPPHDDDSPGAAPAPSTAPSAELAAATSPEALDALAERYPRDPAVRAALVRTHSAAKRHREAVAAAREFAALGPTPPLDDGVLQALRVAALSAETEADALAALESLPGPQGANVLYDLSSAKEVPAKAQAAALRSLGKPEVREKASPALAIFLEFKQAKDCEAKHALLPRVVEVGDKRMVALLKPLLSRRGCGGGFLRAFPTDCNPCLRNDTLLTDALAAVGGRDAER
ncbi:MAG TPA: protein kinase [Polyangiaceae bacterium]|nr:protein kinase [Polyangiaceae bacterium]